MKISDFSKNSDFWQLSFDGNGVILEFNLPAGSFTTGHRVRRDFFGKNKKGMIIDHYCCNGKWSFSNKYAIESSDLAEFGVHFEVIRNGSDIAIAAEYYATKLENDGIWYPTETQISAPSINVKIKLDFIAVHW